MRFDRRALVFKSMKSGLGDEEPYWSYEDIGVFPLSLQYWVRSFTFSYAFIFSPDRNLKRRDSACKLR